MAVHPGEAPIAPTFDNVAAQKYPLSRTIYMFVNREPGKPLSPVLREFLRYALSREGQQAVVDDGIFTPLPAALDAKERGEAAVDATVLADARVPTVFLAAGPRCLRHA